MNGLSSPSALRSVREVSPTEAGIREGRSGLMKSLERLGLAETHLFAIELCLHEALVNALVHGIWESGGRRISLSCEADDTCLSITVEDDGGRSTRAGGGPADAPPVPTWPSRAAPDASVVGMKGPGGRGLGLIRALMTQVTQERAGHGITMSLDLKEGAGHAH
jgi:anti-sigma regulatory factor (Ser/Thr protein kinase)